MSRISVVAERMVGMPQQQRRFVVPAWAAWGWTAAWAVLLLLPTRPQATDRPALAWLGVLVVGVCFVFATVGALGRDRLPGTVVLGLLVLQAAATGWLATVDGLAWGTLPMLMAIAVGAAVRSLWAPALVVVVSVAAVLVVHAQGTHWDAAVLGTGLTVLLGGLLTFVLCWLGSVVGELTRTREELARSAVAAERIRFSRDLHDLLGHTLSVMVVKAQAARRTAGTDPVESARQASDIEAIGREALTQVREAVQGYRRTTLDAELDAAVGALRAAGIEAELVRDGAAVTPVQEELLAWVVREGTTNVIRHAGARRATITTRGDGYGALVSIEDDGTGAGSGAGLGSGLPGLRERLRQSGGTLEATGDASGFRLTALVPATAPEDRL
jgi:two-component system sensor histidine kinase DesK